MITPGVMSVLRETARLDPDDIASFALLRIGDHDARQIVDALPTATLDTLRLLLEQPTTETLEIVRRDQTLEP